MAFPIVFQVAIATVLGYSTFQTSLFLPVNFFPGSYFQKLYSHDGLSKYKRRGIFFSLLLPCQRLKVLVIFSNHFFTPTAAIASDDKSLTIIAEVFTHIIRQCGSTEV